MKQVDGKEIYTVSEINHLAKQMLERMIFWVEGEISSCKKNPNWNFYYLDLKDEKTVLPSIAEGYMLSDLGEEPVGQKILAFGNLSLYEPSGKYQFRIARIEKAGEGLLQKQLEELIKKLRSEGLFDLKHKKAIPKYPKRVCIVTSEGSDAWNDFKKHTVDKFPIIELFTADVRVQGPQSIPSLLKILPQVDSVGFDVIVITRGGGSIEDLAAFNDEKIARTIFAMKTPSVVAIGHEANESLAEWVADVMASTPTDAANIVTSGYNTLLAEISHFAYRLNASASYYFSTNFQKLDHIYFKLAQTKVGFKDLPHRLNSAKESLRRHEKLLISDAQTKIDEHLSRIKKAMRLYLQSQLQSLSSVYKALTLLSVDNTLSRGYSITTDKKGQIIRSIAAVVVGDIIGVKLTDGKLKSKVTEKL
ncbi:exodeoxyribonuclease VII large subunit [Candidatus Curtissbacteria bacterium]|nr:exodeoxyribonuclease VII large subunit [Candidatus Curtissbacteria bacterium]